MRLIHRLLTAAAFSMALAGCPAVEELLTNTTPVERPVWGIAVTPMSVRVGNGITITGKLEEVGTVVSVQPTVKKVSEGTFDVYVAATLRVKKEGAIPEQRYPIISVSATLVPQDAGEYRFIGDSGTPSATVSVAP